MNLGELKQSLSKLPPDMDDVAVVFQCLAELKDKPDFFILAGTGYIENPACIVLLDERMAKQHIAKRTPKLGT